MEWPIKYLKLAFILIILIATSCSLNFLILKLQNKLSPPLSVSCSGEIKLYCPRIEAGRGNLGQCLMKQFPTLNEKCQKQIYGMKLRHFGHSPEGYLFFLFQSFAIFGGIFLLMHLLRAKTDYEGLKTDIAFFILDLLFVRLGSILIVLGILQLVLLITPAAVFGFLETLNLLLPQNNILRLIIYVMMVDFLGYFCHRIMHTKYFWKYHRAHHSSTSLQWHSNFRTHPVNSIFQSVIITIPIMVLGLNKLTYVYFLSYMIFFDAYAHSDISYNFKAKWLRPLRFLKYIIVIPEYHRFHHQEKSVGSHQNYAGIFPLWDFLFKTGEFNLSEEKSFGAGKNYPENFLPLLIRPFKEKRK